MWTAAHLNKGSLHVFNATHVSGMSLSADIIYFDWVKSKHNKIWYQTIQFTIKIENYKAFICNWYSFTAFNANSSKRGNVCVRMFLLAMIEARNFVYFHLDGENISNENFYIKKKFKSPCAKYMTDYWLTKWTGLGILVTSVQIWKIIDLMNSGQSMNT